MRKKDTNDISVTLRLSPATHRSLERLQKTAGKHSIHEVIDEAIESWVRGAPVPVTESLDTLTPRQREVLGWIAQGSTNREIAGHLGISVKTVEMHRTQLMSALDIHNVAGLVRFALRAGLIKP